MSILPEFVTFAHTLADASGNVIRPLFRTSVAVDTKADTSPVTFADRQAESIMREQIIARYPDHGIWGEESGRHNPGAKYCWVLDPIDGTKSFISGLPTFGTLIALVRLGIPILGLIDQPISKERWLGHVGTKATLNDTIISTRACPRLDLAFLSTTSPRLFNIEDKIRFKRLQETVRYVKYGYDCYAYAMLASGHIDLVAETGLKPHDFCALRAVIEAAGGIITDWHGRPLTLASDGRVLAAGDKQLHALALELLK